MLLYIDFGYFNVNLLTLNIQKKFIILEKLNNFEAIMNEKAPPDIAKFLVRDTTSLRNEINFTELINFVHPLTFCYDVKKHPNMCLIPVMDKLENKELKDLFLKIIE